jgi:D-lactate dehydrogenase
MKPVVAILNRSHGALTDMPAPMDTSETGRIGVCSLDVYEQSTTLFFEHPHLKLSRILTVKPLIKIATVLVREHQAFSTKEALNTDSRNDVDECQHLS